MGRKKNLVNLFKPDRRGKTKQGEVGYDNPRENIDPHIKTKVIDTKEITQSGASYDLSTLSNNWTSSGGYIYPTTASDKISGGDLCISKAGWLTLIKSGVLYMHNYNYGSRFRAYPASNECRIGTFSNDNLRIYAGGSTAILIDDDQNVCIGTSVNNYWKFQVKGNANVQGALTSDYVVSGAQVYSDEGYTGTIAVSGGLTITVSGGVILSVA